MTLVVVIVTLVLGIALGLKRRFIRLIMSCLVASFVTIITPALYSGPGYFFASFEAGSREGTYRVAFFLTSVVLLLIFEALFLWSFKDTSLPRLGPVDRILGALVGVVWGLLLAGLLFIPFGGMRGSDPLIGLVRIVFRPLLVVLHAFYRADFIVGGLPR